MIELRWLIKAGAWEVLQYRQKIMVTDYQTENHISVPQWSEWKDVPEVHEDE